MPRIYYSKLFLSGLLKGLVVPTESWAMSEAEAAKRWYIGKEGRDIITKAQYRIVDASFQKYAR